MAKSKVAIEPCGTYVFEDVDRAVRAAVTNIGGIARFVAPGQKVLLKVNLLNASAPERAVTTHPEVLRAVIRLVKEAGGLVTVGDSPGGRNTAGAVKKIHATTGIGEVCVAEGVPLILFDDDIVRVEAPNSRLYQYFTIGRAVLDADVVITIPRLKTHGFQMFTGAVKNLFGVIPGLQKAEYHVKVPDREDFAEMLIDLYLLVKPMLAIMDGIVAMEGDGPSGGSPYHLGLILAGDDCVALDFIATKIVGFEDDMVYTNRAAKKRGLPADMSMIDLAGIGLDAVSVKDFDIPKTEAGAGLPPFLRERLNDILIAKPALMNAPVCDGCAVCFQNCPVDAIKMVKQHPTFDYDKCIRCYCCDELCPQRAIGLKRHWLFKVWQAVGG